MLETLIDEYVVIMQRIVTDEIYVFGKLIYFDNKSLVIEGPTSVDSLSSTDVEPSADPYGEMSILNRDYVIEIIKCNEKYINEVLGYEQS